jgi:hypothetical protein
LLSILRWRNGECAAHFIIAILTITGGADTVRTMAQTFL